MRQGPRHGHPARILFTLLLCFTGFALMSAGACFPVPLGEPEQGRLDERLTGFWCNEDVDGGGGGVLIIAPFDEHAFVVQVMRFEKQANGAVEPKGSPWVFKAWLTDVKGTRFLSARQLSNLADVRIKPDYFVVRADLDGGKLKLISVDPTAVNVADATRLLRAIEKRLDDPALYFGNPSTFRRLDPGVERDKALIDAVSPAVTVKF